MAVASVGTPVITAASVGSVVPAYAGSQPRTVGNALLTAVMVSAVTSTTAISTPAGWTKLTEVTASNTRTAWYWAIALGGDAAPTFTSTISGTGGMNAIPLELSGAGSQILIATTGSSTTVSTTTLATGTTGLAVPTTGCMGLSAFGAFTSAASTRTWTPGASWSNVASSNALAQRHTLIVDLRASLPAGSAISESGTFSTTPTNESNMIVVINPVQILPGQYSRRQSGRETSPSASYGR